MIQLLSTTSIIKIVLIHIGSFFDAKRSILESHMAAVALSASFGRDGILCSTFKADLKI
jgi:hypothetical protein